MSRLRVALQVSASLSAVASAAAQVAPGIQIGAGVAIPIRAQPSAKFAVPVVIDMGTASDVNVASITATVKWNPAIARLDSVRGGRPAFGTLIHNTAKSPTGEMVLSMFNAAGTTKTVAIATLYFTAGAGPGATEITFAPTVAGNEAGQNIIARVRPRHAPVCVNATPAACGGGP